MWWICTYKQTKKKKVYLDWGNRRLTQRAGKVRARACKTDLGSQGWGKATVHRHHPCSAPETGWRRKYFILFLSLFCGLEDVHTSNCPSSSAKMSEDTEKVPYLRAESGLFMKVAVHEVAILPGCDFTPWRKTGRTNRLHVVHRTNSPAQPTDTLLSHLPLVPMQQGRPVMVQSMWGRLVWFPVLYLVQI